MGSKEWSGPAKIVNGLAGELPEGSGLRSWTCDNVAGSKFEVFEVSEPDASEALTCRDSSCDRADRVAKSRGGDTQGADGTTHDSERS